MLTLNLVGNTLIFALAARFYVWPRLGATPTAALLTPILLLHGTRHLGMMFLARGTTLPGLPDAFAYPAALGDLTAAILALCALFALRAGLSVAVPLTWIFNIVGSVDLVAAIALATVYDAGPFMSAAYWIPAFWVPALLVSHYVTFVILVRKKGESW
jgi:hypothetical protein